MSVPKPQVKPAAQYSTTTGTEYEIDLNAKHAQQCRDALARYVAAARRTGSTRQPARSRRKATASAVNTTEVREWAKTQGIDVEDRGRIPPNS